MGKYKGIIRNLFCFSCMQYSFPWCVFLVVQLCPTLCDPMDCSPPGSSVPEDFPGNNTGVGCQAFFYGIFPTLGSNTGLPQFRHSLPSEPPGKPMSTEMVSLSLLQGIFPTQELKWGFLHCRQILHELPGKSWCQYSFSSVQFSRSVVSDSLRPHESQHARRPCPSPTPGVYSNSCSLSR